MFSWLVTFNLLFAALVGALGERIPLINGPCPVISSVVTFDSRGNPVEVASSLRCPVGRESPNRCGKKILFQS